MIKNHLLSKPSPGNSRHSQSHLLIIAAVLLALGTIFSPVGEVFVPTPIPLSLSVVSASPDTAHRPLH